MNKNFTDGQIDQLLQKMVNDAAFADTKVDEIANSPQLWWGVQRKIKADEKSASNAGSGFFRRWLLLGAPLTVAALLVFAYFAFQPAEIVDHVSGTTPQISNETVTTGSEKESVEDVSPAITAAKPVTTAMKRTNLVKKTIAEKDNPRPQKFKSTATVVKSESVEVKSEFIALSYARKPDSGQIVRVKVPSSMMVSLGLVASVEKPTNLVNAEILIGDDGMTHAIRFIR